MAQGFQGFEGFQFETPEAVQARTMQGFQQAMASGNYNAQMAARAQAVAFNLVGSPELREAQEKKQLLTQATKGLTPTGDAVEDEIVRLKAIQGITAEKFPELTMQATRQLTALTVGQEERARLKAQETREASKAKLQEDEAAFGRQRLMVTEDGETVGFMDPNKPEDVAKWEAAQEKYGKLRLVTHEQMAGFDNDMRIALARMNAEGNRDNGIPKTTQNRYILDAKAQLPLAMSYKYMVEFLTKNPGAFTNASSFQSSISNAATQGRAYVSSFGGAASSELETQVGERLTAFGIADGMKRSMVMDMAYAMATAREGGRLTDQDIDRAIETLGYLGNPNPASVMSVLRHNIEKGMQQWEDNSSLIDAAKNMPSTYAAPTKRWKEAMDAADLGMKQYEQVASTVLPGITPPEAGPQPGDAAKARNAARREALFGR